MGSTAVQTAGVFRLPPRGTGRGRSCAEPPETTWPGFYGGSVNFFGFFGLFVDSGFVRSTLPDAMKFMLLFQIDEKCWADLSQPERETLMSECDRYAQDMVASGHARACAALHPSSTATTLRVQGGRRLITDGPFAETKEVLAGFQIVECGSLDEALDLAARFPPLRVNASVEVRPIRAEGGGVTQP